jgi:D-alanyl-D-alanine dipeptidase
MPGFFGGPVTIGPVTILLSDPRVGAIPVRESGEPLVALGPELGPARARVREGLADRLRAANASLRDGITLRVVEGHRPEALQRKFIARYAAVLTAAHPGIGAVELERLTSRFVSPVAVAPHVAGAAVDLTLVDAHGDELDLGTPIDATPEESGGACYFASPDIPPSARAHRDLLAAALESAGLVNYPTEWWHWSFGDRYWALATGAPAALYGPLDDHEGVA